MNGLWEPGEPRADVFRHWIGAAWERKRPHATAGSYVNFQLAEDSPARTAEAYGSNDERLRRIKAAYDPDNLFRTNRNIPPAR